MHFINLFEKKKLDEIRQPIILAGVAVRGRGLESGSLLCWK